MCQRPLQTAFQAQRRAQRCRVAAPRLVLPLQAELRARGSSHPHPPLTVLSPLL
jgi:hypothetical protein